VVPVSHKTTATVWIEAETLRRIEELVRQGRFKSKSEFFRKAVEEFLARLEEEGEGGERGG